MSLILNLAEFVEDNTSLDIDTNLFVGGDVYDSPSGSVTICEIPGSNTNWSELKERVVHFIIKDLAYISTETLANTVYALFNQKAGFTNVNLVSEGIFFCEPYGSPTPIDRDDRGNYIFTFTVIMRTS